MKNAPAILAAYNISDGHFEQLIEKANRSASPARAQKATEAQILNDQAYFILLWGQLESEIDDRCRAEISKRQQDASWSIRRAWDLYNPADRRLSGLAFEERVALLTDKQGGRGSPWAKIMRYYAVRNKIAHGDLSASGIDITIIVHDFYSIASSF